MPVRIADQVAEILRQSGNISEIREKFRSASQVCEGLRIFLEEADGLVSEKRSTLQALDKELSAKQIELGECKTTVETLFNETGALRAEKQQLALDVERLDKKKSRLHDEITGLQQQ
jgi:chromosome segregation ATPase